MCRVWVCVCTRTPRWTRCFDRPYVPTESGYRERVHREHREMLHRERVLLNNNVHVEGSASNMFVLDGFDTYLQDGDPFLREHTQLDQRFQAPSQHSHGEGAVDALTRVRAGVKGEQLQSQGRLRNPRRADQAPWGLDRYVGFLQGWCLGAHMLETERSNTVRLNTL